MARHSWNPSSVWLAACSTINRSLVAIVVRYLNLPLASHILIQRSLRWLCDTVWCLVVHVCGFLVQCSTVHRIE